jgi:hypothetical protein
MVWLDAQESTSYYLVSVSDDSDPNGTWYNWALPSNVNGSTPSGNWADYQGVGYDENAVYLTSNQFSFGGSSQYVKVRILNKSDLYANTAGPVNWKDFWNISQFGLRPTRSYSTSTEYYFLGSSSGGGTKMHLWKLSDPLGTPSMSYTQIPVNTYLSPPKANQLGGGTPLLEGGGANIRNEPVYRDGLIHAVHAVKDGNFSAVRYISIDPQTNSKVKDVAMGTGQHYHTYPALAVSSDNDVILTYSRSANDEYMGAYYTILAADSAAPIGSIALQEGRANYVKTFSGSRNRWGDYNGAWTDPVDENNFWVYTEYVKSTNTWADWLAGIRIKPYDDAYILCDKDEIDFGLNEVSISSDVNTITINNFGSPTLSITNIENFNSDFVLLDNLSFPIFLEAYENFSIQYQFTPSSAGEFIDSVVISSNDPNDPQFVVNLLGNAYSINAASNGLLYAFTGASSGKLLTVNTTTAEGTEIGQSDLPSTNSLTMSPDTKILYCLTMGGANSQLNRINATGGDGYYLMDLPHKYDAIVFDTDNTLLGISDDKKLYSIDLSNGNSTFITDIDIKVKSAAINPVDGILWAGADSSSNKDALYTVDKATGAAALIGNTGSGKYTDAMAFDGDGKLFTITLALKSYLNNINTATGEGTEIGTITGFNLIRGLAITNHPVVQVEEDISLPLSFNLEQNYPNPFNPSTIINFSLPVDANVRLSIFNLLGQEVEVLLNKDMSAGNQIFEWNAGKNNISSGVYLYRIQATGVNGKIYDAARKMILVK